MNFYLKYIKYKHKYLYTKNLIGNGKEEKKTKSDNIKKAGLTIEKKNKSELEEEEIFKKIGIPTNRSIIKKTNEDILYNQNIFPNKFFINCHGSQIINIKKIRIPKNFIIYFQSENNEKCSLERDTNEEICYFDENIINEFRNIDYDYWMSTPDPVKPVFWNKRWLNKYTEDMIIYDCLLGRNEKKDTSSNLIFCSSIVGIQVLYKLDTKIPILFSQLIKDILIYIVDESIQPPYHIFCSFCIVQHEISLDHSNALKKVQDEINDIYTKIQQMLNYSSVQSLYSDENISESVYD